MIYKFDKKLKICILCGSNSLEKWTKVNGLNVDRCRNCDIRFINPQFNDKYLNNFYKSGLTRWITLKEYKKMRKKHFLFYKNLLEKIKAPNKALLDFGCGVGYFLDIMIKFGWKTAGIEISKKDREEVVKKGIPVFSLKEIKEIRKDYFGVCTMLDFLEHVKDPLKYLKIAHEKLVPGGIVLIDTGDVGGLASITGRNYNPFLKNEGHITFFTKKSIIFLLEKVGFKVLDIFDERVIFNKFNKNKKIRRDFFYCLRNFFMDRKKILLNTLKFFVTNPNMIILGKK